MNAIFIDFPRLLSYFCCVLLCGLLSGCGNGSERSEINSGTNRQVRVNQSHAVSATNETPSASRMEKGAQSYAVGRTNDSRPSVSSAASASPRNVKLFPTDAVSVVFEGNVYDYDQAMLLLPTILQSTNSLQKKRWYYAISEFRTKLQGEPVSKLIDAFRTEAEPVVREAILNAVEFSRDSRFADLCLSAQNDSNPNIRLRAGALF